MVKELGPSEFVGEAALLGDGRRNASVRAKTELHVLELSIARLSRGFTAAVPTENPYCSCKLTRVRSSPSPA